MNFKWNELHPTGCLPPPLCEHTLTAVGNELFVVGGYNKACRGSHRFNTNLYRLDLTSMLWMCSAVSHRDIVPRSGHHGFGYKADLYIYGGFRNNMPYGHQWDSTLYRFSCSTGTWTVVMTSGNKPCGRASAGVTLFDDILFVFGGHALIGDPRKGEQMDDRSVYLLDLPTMKWEKIAAAPRVSPPCLYNVAAAASGKAGIAPGCVIVYGGRMSAQSAVRYGFSEEYSNFVFKFDMRTKTWTKGGTAPGTANASRDSHTMNAMDDGRIVLFGGFCGTSGSDLLGLFGSQGWEHISGFDCVKQVGRSGCGPRFYHAATWALGKLFVYGGTDIGDWMSEARGNPGHCLSDLWELQPEINAFAEGQLVEAHSLKAAVELNGLQGHCTGKWQGERLGVAFPSPHGIKALRPDNLRLVSSCVRQSPADIAIAGGFDRLRLLISRLETREFGSDEVVASVLKAAPGLSFIYDDYAQQFIGGMFLLKQLKSLAFMNPIERCVVADFRSSCKQGRAFEEMQLLDFLLKCLPMWTSTQMGSPVAWFMLTDCIFTLDKVYSADTWSYQSQDVDSAGVTNTSKNVHAVWHDNSYLLHALSLKCAHSDYPGLIVRILRCDENPSSRAAMQKIKLETVPSNVLTLWILEDSPIKSMARGTGLEEVLRNTLSMSAWSDDDEDNSENTEKQSYSKKKRRARKRNGGGYK